MLAPSVLKDKAYLKTIPYAYVGPSPRFIVKKTTMIQIMFGQRGREVK